MQIIGKKGCKPFIVKILALLIGTCYLANPLQYQIEFVFHEISHLVTTPDILLAVHSPDSSYDSGDGHHHQHEHGNDVHGHEFIDLLASIFDASNEDNPCEHANLVDNKFDKHTRTASYVSKINFRAKAYRAFENIDEKLSKPFLKRLEEPPRPYYPNILI